jgi:phosphoadenosine phosphosulfate reductase
MSDSARRVAETRAILERIARDFTPAVFASSLAAEDMVLTDLILKAGLPIGIFSLETGRLHQGNPGRARQGQGPTATTSPCTVRPGTVDDYVARTA